MRYHDENYETKLFTGTTTIQTILAPVKGDYKKSVIAGMVLQAVGANTNFSLTYQKSWAASGTVIAIFPVTSGATTIIGEADIPLSIHAGDKLSITSNVSASTATITTRDY